MNKIIEELLVIEEQNLIEECFLIFVLRFLFLQFNIILVLQLYYKKMLLLINT